MRMLENEVPVRTTLEVLTRRSKAIQNRYLALPGPASSALEALFL